MTTRKQFLSLAVGCLALLTGCATPGPLHVYTLSPTQPAIIRDQASQAPTDSADVPSFLKAEDQLTGLAYDPFTDHFFLRLAPGNLIRVVDRPARAIKREFTAEQLGSSDGGDLAVRPRDGHLFFLQPRQRTIVELTRLGEFVRVISLSFTPAVPMGIAYDATQHQLYVLSQQEIVTCEVSGREKARIRLDRAVRGSLAFDDERREFYAPLSAPAEGIGVFGPDGQWRRTLSPGAPFVDLGPRSFLRLF